MFIYKSMSIPYSVCNIGYMRSI
uniref:Uncharacterized protein n=1 Tax=Arundo donax TaxID=35708 RepID=A0A0A8YTE2_ARUDO